MNLITEAERYLAAIAVFRSEGCEPEWRLEPTAQPRRRLAADSLIRDLLEPSPTTLD